MTTAQSARPLPVAVFSDDLVTDFPAAAWTAAELGASGIAVRNVGGRNVSQLTDDEVTEIRQVADEHGLAVSALASPIGRGWFLDEDGGQERALTMLDRMVRQARILGTSNVRIFGPWLRGHDAYEMWSDRPDYTLCLDRLADELRPAVERAELAGVTLMIETEGASYVGQAREARLLIERLGSAALALCWDPANAWRSGERPWPDGFAEATRVRIADVHAKDLDPDIADPSWPGLHKARTGEGGVGYQTILPALAESGYRGFVTVERNYHPRRPEDDPALTADVLADLANLVALVGDLQKGQ